MSYVSHVIPFSSRRAREWLVRRLACIKIPYIFSCDDSISNTNGFNNAPVSPNENIFK